MAKYDEDQIAAVREALPRYLANVHGVIDTKRPFRCLSPDHEDRHPSMSFDAKRCRVKCFSCGVSGDIFDVAGWDTGTTSFFDKVEAAAEGAGIEVGELKQGSSGRRARSSKFPIPGIVRKKPAPIVGDDFFDACFDAYCGLFSAKGGRAVGYLADRGFSPSEIVRYGWGWVAHPSDMMPGRFDRIPPRDGGFVSIPFPNDPDWDCTCYAVFRAVDGREPKELKPEGLPSPLWHEYLLRIPGEVHVVEGVFDAASVETMIPGSRSVALCGTANVERMLDVLADTRPSSRPSVILAFDSDESGEKATEKACKGLREIGVRFKVAPSWPGGCKDANECLMMERGSFDWRI